MRLVLVIVTLFNQTRKQMPEPLISQRSPYQVNLVAGKYFWCACGQSKKQPFCDGSHKAKREFTPVTFELNEPKSVWLCGCKHTSNKPFCDGTHKRL